MPRKTRRTSSRNPKTRVRVGRHDGGTSKLRARAKDSPKSEQTGASPPRLRINITKTGSKVRFWFVDQSNLTVAQSRGYDTPGCCKANLIGFIQAIQADDFETFDHT